MIDIVTTAQITIARHPLAPDGAGVIVRDHGYVYALEQVAMAAAGSAGRPHRRKERIPPGPAAIEAADVLRRATTGTATTTSTVIDLSTYERADRGGNTTA